MRLLFVLIFCASSVVFALTLEEKIENARRAADAAVDGNSPDGKIVGGSLDISKNAPISPQKLAEENLPSESQASLQKKSQTELKPKYVVNPDDFINGMYIGRVGQTDAERAEIVESVKKAQSMPLTGAKLSFAETDLFFIAGKDALAVSRLKQVALACETALEQIFPKWEYSKAFVAKNMLRVFPSDTEMKDIVLSSDSAVVFVDIKWGADLKLEDVCAALSKSIFQKLALAKNSKYNVPQWLLWAIECSILDEIKMGVSSGLSREAVDFPHKDIVSILSYSDKDANIVARKAHCYWLLKALLKLSDKTNLFAFVENVAIFGLSPKESFGEMKKIITSPSDVDADLWLGCVICSEICARAGGVDSCAVSRAEILRMCSIRAFIDSQPIGVPFDKLFSVSISKQSVGARLLEIKMLLAKTNPVYFNSAVLLGEVYEAFLKGERAQYNLKIVAFIDEFEKANSTASEVEKIMNKPVGNLSK